MGSFQPPKSWLPGFSRPVVILRFILTASRKLMPQDVCDENQDGNTGKVSRQLQQETQNIETDHHKDDQEQGIHFLFLFISAPSFKDKLS